MPIYEYRCRECGNIEEFFVVGSEEVTIRCEKCGSRDMEKIMSPAAFMLNSVSRSPGKTCCGREERCDTPPCSTGGSCRRDN
ncbi:MAG TPA: zinc ribbon domain-containing protein [Desulfobacterales bacterium]|nr:zinc ribbon domain-containing protein [Desulfobacterales bacterium]